MTIWKYFLEVNDFNRIPMPYEATVLTLAVQGDQPCLWALVDPMASHMNVPRTFRTYSTGQAMPDNPGIYIGTYQLRGGSLAFHVFEVQS
jgi:hypothetical protein